MMTEKRFTVKDDVGMLDVACANIFDNGEFIGTVPLFDAEKFVDLLNALNDENKQLKDSLNFCKENVKRLHDDKKELINENEQLKKENYELHKRLGDFEPFERYMKERTSKTSVNDIIGLVKTDEPTDSVELKKGLYK